VLIKDKLSFILRHELYTIFPIDNLFIIQHWIDFNQELLENSYIIIDNTSINQYILNVFIAIGKKNYNLIVHRNDLYYRERQYICNYIMDQITTIYPYENEILLVEFRSFHKYLELEMKIKKPNLDILIPFLIDKNKL
jgi:hypothetical protein